MDTFHQFTKVEFKRFKAFKSFRLELRHFNIMVGPNNAGKSTVLAAIRILAAGLRRAQAKNSVLVQGPDGPVLGHRLDLSAISVAEENIFFNYDASEPSQVTFYLSNQNKLILYFPEPGSCFLIAEAHGKATSSPSAFRKSFNCPIGFVPILGPVEHQEPLYDKEAARLALFNYRAARNFRNIWHHYPEKFEEFRSTLQQTWPGMDIERPEIDKSHEKPRLYMYCPESRIPRELFWAGFGFQVWCQMLTHLVQSKNVSLFLIDEPDIYLHSELQRHLLTLLRNLGPDILLATHSTEIITEAEPDDIILINKNNNSAKRLKDPTQLENVFEMLGSNTNPILTQLAKTRCVVFVEGKDFGIIGRFARKLGKVGIGNRRDFAVVPVDGFNTDRIRSLKEGMETTLGSKIQTCAVLDRDYRSAEECKSIETQCKSFCDFVIIHDRKEIENFLLVASAIDRAAERLIADRSRRTGVNNQYQPMAEKALEEFSFNKRSYVTSQHLSELKKYMRSTKPSMADAQLTESGLDEFEKLWSTKEARLMLIPGKEALSFLNSKLQHNYGTSLTTSAIIEAMHVSEVPDDMRKLIAVLEQLAKMKS
jgi:ABC-type nitrate/sulfonate/bicarbonate transport system ATPase subunit